MSEREEAIAYYEKETEHIGKRKGTEGNPLISPFLIWEQW